MEEEIVKVKEQRGAYGTCAICGAHKRSLKVTAMTDFIGWACDECREQLWQSSLRLYCPTFEQTEPSE